MTMASDTHVPEGTGWRIDPVADQAREADYSHRAVFQQRQHDLVGLDDEDNSTGQRA